MERITDARILNEVPQIGQDTNAWCWAASALMVGKRYTPNTTKKQSDIVKHIHKIVADIGGNITNMADASTFATNDTVKFEPRGYVFSEAELLQQLNSGNPVAIIRSKSFFDDGHAVVIYGYVNYKGVRYLIRDPWPKDKVTFYNKVDSDIYKSMR